MRRGLKLFVLIGSIFGLGSVSQAATASWSSSSAPPPVNGADIASFVGSNNDGGNIYGGNDDGTFLTSNRPGQGQEFTTGSDTNGYYLNAFTLRHVTYNSPVSMDSGWPPYDGSHFEIKIGTISGGSFSATAVEVTADLAGDDPDSPGYQNNSGPKGSYLTLTLDTPVYLYPNTTYAVSVWLDGGAYMEVNGNGTTSANYTGGEAFSELGGTVYARTGDRVFHCDMIVSPDGPPPPPEVAQYAVLPTTDPVQTVDLSGTWNFTPDGSSQTTIQVPGGGWFKQGFTTVDTADYEKTITIPNVSSTQRTVLEFGAVNYQADLYVDDVLVGVRVQAWTPASWDISDYVTPGSSHTVRVHVLSMGARMQGTKSLDPNGAGSWAFDDSANPTRTFLAQGIFRSAELKIYPEVYIKDVFVRTSVKDSALYYDVTLYNGSASTANVTLSGDLTSWNGDPWSYPSLPSQPVSLPARTNTTVTVGPVSWNLGSTSYWWPNVPYQQGYQAKLHNLNLSLSGDSTHSTTTRFGFREITQEPDGLGNTCYFLNGIRVNFRGDNLQGANYDRIDYNGQGDAYDTYPGFLPGPNGWPKAVDNYLRLNMSGIRIHQIPASPYMLNVCDEMGLMIEDETGIRGAGAQQDFNAGRDNMVNHVKALFARDRNHASVLRLSLCNEPDWGGGAAEFIQDLYDAAQTVDQTRPYAVDTGAASYDELAYANFAAFPHYGVSHSEWGKYTDEVYARPDRPYGCGEFIWDADNTKPGFTWFGTATAAMRAKGASDTRPYTLLSAWSSVIPGTSTTEMRLENPPWNSATLRPLYGEDNLPDPWSNYQIKRVQAGFNPVLVADAGYWEVNKTSNLNGDWPSVFEVLPPNTLVTRTLNIFNDTFSGGTAVDVYWELHQDSATGTLLDSGVVNATVPYGYVANEDISFNTPNAPEGTILNLVLAAKKNGVEMFREEQQSFVLSSITPYGGLVNPGFEQPAAGKIVDGFDGAIDVPGWTDIGSLSDSGIEAAGISHSGDYSAFLMGDYEYDGYPSTPDHGMRMNTGYTIQSGDSITVTFWARIDSASNPGWIDVTCRLFGGTNPDLRILGETRFGDFQNDNYTTPPALSGVWQYCQVTVADASAQAGQTLGIAFYNSQFFWASVDDVTLWVNQTPPDFIPPNTPFGFTASPGNNTVLLDWADNTDSIAGYNVYRSIAPGGPYLTLATGLGSSSYTDNNAYNGITYYYVVSAVDNSGLESRSGEATATPGSIGNPGDNFAESDSSVSGSSSGGLANTYYSDDVYMSITEETTGGNPANRMSFLEHIWTFDIGAGGNPGLSVEAHHTANSEGDDFIFSYSADGNNFTDVLTVTKTSDNDSAQSVSLPGGLTGTVYIRVVDADQTGGNDVADTLYVDQLYIHADDTGGGGDTTPPAAPTGLSATGGEGYVALDWNDNSELDLASYTVYRSTTSGSGYSAIASGVVTSSYADNAVVNGTTYYYVVTATDAFSNESGNSSEVSTSASSDTTPPAAPTGLTATAGDGSVTLNWADNSEPDLASYTVYRSTTSGSGYSVIASGLASSAYTDNSVVNGTTYYYVVTATDDSSNESSSSSEVLAIPAVPIALTNADFEAGVVNYPDGFDGTPDVPGWMDYTITDSGVEGSAAWWGTYNNSYSAFMAPGDGAYLLSGYTIQSGDEFALSFVAKAWYGGSSEWTVTLFYNDPANVIGTYVTGTTGNWAQYGSSTTIPATAGSVGGTLGILFVNTGAEYGTLDDVSLSVISSGPPDTTPPAAPTGLAATAGDGSVDLDWADNGEPDLASYTVYRSTTSGSGYTSIASGLGVSAYTDNTVANGTTYFYVVTATDTSSNESANSAEASATPQSNNPPAFTADPINEIAATEDAAYSSTLADDASDPDAGDTLTFSKVSGPAWLIVAGNGALSGTPANGDVGANVFTVRVTDSASAFDDATLNITVNNVNDAPTFTSDPISKPDATVDQAYSDTLAGDATDVDAGDVLTFSKVSGPAWLSVAADGTLSGTPAAGDVGPNSWVVEVSDLQSATDQATLDIVVSDGTTDDVANGEIVVAGTVSGTFAATQTSDDGYESIQEVQSGGKPANRYSYLEHKWTINVTGGSSVTLFVEAYQSSSSDGDNFVFAWSTDDVNYTDALTVNKTSDDDVAQSAALPSSLAGLVYIRVRDTDQTAGNQALDTVFVDQLYIQSQTVAGPPSTPTGLAATPGDMQVSLSWSAAPGADSYNVKRATSSGGPYTTVSNVAGTSTTDTGLVNGTTYYYVVSAVNTYGESGDSGEASATPMVASTMHVQSIVVTTVSAGAGNKRGHAEVLIQDGNGSPVANATVSGTFSGTIAESASGVTSGSGLAVIETTGTAKGGVTITFCVDNVTHATLVYDPNANQQTCGNN